jgi:hypothetical protein
MEMTQESIMGMMNKQLEMLQVDFENALKDLGKISRNKNKSQEEYAIYFERQDRCNICEAKINLMEKMINKMSEMFSGTPMRSTAKL